MILGPHEDPASAQRFLRSVLRGWTSPRKPRAASLEPFRHHGAANYLDRVPIRAFAYGQAAIVGNSIGTVRFGDRTSFIGSTS